MKAYRAALREHLPGPLLVWGVVEGGGDRTKEFDAGALCEAAMEREEGEDLWLFTSEGEIGEAVGAVGIEASGIPGLALAAAPVSGRRGRPVDRDRGARIVS